MRLTGDGAERHAPCAEAGHDVSCTLHLLQGHRLASRHQLQAVAQHYGGPIGKVLLIGRICFLQRQTPGMSLGYQTSLRQDLMEGTDAREDNRAITSIHPWLQAGPPAF